MTPSTKYILTDGTQVFKILIPGSKTHGFVTNCLIEKGSNLS